MSREDKGADIIDLCMRAYKILGVGEKLGVFHLRSRIFIFFLVSRIFCVFTFHLG